MAIRGTRGGPGGGQGEGVDMATSGESQQQMAAPEAETRQESPEDARGIQHFDTTISKVKTLETGEEIEVMSDHLMPGEKLTRATTAEKEAKKLEERRKASEKQS